MELGMMMNAFRFRRSDSKNVSSYIDQLRGCADAGFRVLDFNTTASARPSLSDELAGDDWEAVTDKLGGEAAKRGLRFSQSHAPYNANLFLYGKQPDEEYFGLFREMCRRTVIAAGRLGVKWVVVHPQTDTVNTEYDNGIQLKTNVEFYSPLLEQAKRNGVGLAFENMAETSRDPSRRYCADTDDLLELVSAFNDPSVGVCWDFGHGRIMLSDTPRQLRRLGSRLKATHVHDNRGERDSHLIPFVGGNIKWEAVMPTLREIGYSGDFILECHSFMQQIPDGLRPAAGRLAHEFGMHCMKLYEES